MEIEKTNFETELAVNRTHMSEERTQLAENRTQMAEERTHMAEDRTKMAYERTALANSQTLLSYSRTAIATFAAGIGMFEFIDNATIVSIGIAFMAIAPIIFVIGVIHYLRVKKKIKKYLDN